MNKFTKEILDYLVEKYEAATGKKMQFDETMNSEQKQYYFKNLEDNLIEEMSDEVMVQYKTGDGNELEEKMRAIRSSSAMTYNLLGNTEVTIKDGNKYFSSGVYKVEFEKQLRTIKRSPRKANLDAFLESEQELIFCEMKMTEWLFNKPGLISENYLDEGHYFDKESYTAFKKLIEKIIIDETTDYRNYYGRLQQYDGVQMFKHLLGIYNYMMQEDKCIHKKVRLVNCVWELSDTAVLSEESEAIYRKKVKLEKDEFKEFYKAAQPVIELFAEKGIEFDIHLVSFSEMLHTMEKNSSQSEFLERYL